MATLPLGLACVAQSTREAGHDVRIVDLMEGADAVRTLEEAVRDLAPDVIGISVRNIDDQLMRGGRFLLEPVRQMVARCKALSAAPVVLGGAGYSIFPREALSYLDADMGIEGEGEAAFPNLLKMIHEGIEPSRVPGLHLPGRGSSQRALARKLDGFPLPDRRVWSPPAEDALEPWMPVQTRRGCSLACSYCSTPAIEGKALRKRSPGAVAEWMKSRSDEGFRNFFFVDNTFNLPPSYAKELCRELINNVPDVRWRAIVHPHRMDGDLARLMAHAGCVQISLGFESGSERMLRNMNKNFRPSEVARTVELFSGNGVGVMGFLLLGGPGEDRGSVEESLAFADSLDLQAVKVTAGVRIYPNTPLARTALAEGVVSPDDNLLHPRFYLARQLEGWLEETVSAFMKDRPNWIS